MSATTGGGAGSERPGTWHVLENDLVVVEAWDAEVGRTTYHELQGSRRLEPDDIRGHEQRINQRLGRFLSHWGLIAAVGPKLLVLAVIAVPVGLGLGQLDATAAVGSWLFWVGIPVAVVLYVLLRIGSWRMERTLRALQEEAGLVPGMVTEISQADATRLLETHGIRFTVEQTPA